MYRVTLATVAALILMSISAHAQDFAPYPSEAWRSEDGKLVFDGEDDGTEYVWLYSDHTWARQLLFSIERLTAPHLARNSVVAWAYPVNGSIDFDEAYTDMQAKVAALAFREDASGTYYVLPETVRDEVLNEAEDLLNPTDLIKQRGFSEADAQQWSVWIVSPDVRAYGVPAAEVSSRSQGVIRTNSEKLPWASLGGAVGDMLGGVTPFP